MNFEQATTFLDSDSVQPGVRIITLFLILILILFSLSACGNWGWESIDTDNESKLNILGVISLDDSLQSFIMVHKTLETAGADEEVVGTDTTYFHAYEWWDDDQGIMMHDTFWYDPPYVRTVYESRYLVKDAEVIVSDGTMEYVFVRQVPEARQGEYWYGDIWSDPAIYKDTSGLFNPQPDTRYTLSITTPDGLSLTGETVTPPQPTLKESELGDTLSVRRLFEIRWQSTAEAYGDIATGLLFDNASAYGYICGAEQYGVFDRADSVWVSTLDSWCLEEPIDDVNAVERIGIRLRFLDENYYEYFISTENDAEEISNLLIGDGSIGRSFGVEGGYGVFGSLSADWAERYITP